jgi:histone H3/H4
VPGISRYLLNPRDHSWIRPSCFPVKVPEILCYNEVIKVADLPIAAVVRIAKKSGAERVGSDAAASLLAEAERYIAQLAKESNKLAMHAGRKTIKEEDVYLAAKSV